MLLLQLLQNRLPLPLLRSQSQKQLAQPLQASRLVPQPLPQPQTPSPYLPCWVAVAGRWEYLQHASCMLSGLRRKKQSCSAGLQLWRLGRKPFDFRSDEQLRRARSRAAANELQYRQ